MKSTTISNAIKEIRELFNEVRSNLFREETKRTRKELYKKEFVYNVFFLKKDKLTNKQKIVLKNIG